MDIDLKQKSIICLKHLCVIDFKGNVYHVVGNKKIKIGSIYFKSKSNLFHVIKEESIHLPGQVTFEAALNFLLHYQHLE